MVTKFLLTLQMLRNMIAGMLVVIGLAAFSFAMATSVESFRRAYLHSLILPNR